MLLLMLFVVSLNFGVGIPYPVHSLHSNHKWGENQIVDQRCQTRVSYIHIEMSFLVSYYMTFANTLNKQLKDLNGFQLSLIYYF